MAEPEVKNEAAAKQEKTKPEKEKPSNVWRGTPRVWERCIMCEVRKSCSEAGVVRGSEACVGARYSLRKH